MSDFRFLSHFWSNVLVKYITDLLLVSKNLLADPCLKLPIVDKNDVSQNFNQYKKVECYQ